MIASETERTGSTGRDDGAAVVRFEAQEWLPPEWRFSVELASGAVLTAGPPGPPSARAWSTVAKVRWPGHAAEVEIGARLLEREVELADLLERAPWATGREPLSRAADERGERAELELGWRLGGERRRGRLVAVKSGARVLALFAHGPEAELDRVTRLAQAARTLAVSAPPASPYAEPMCTWEGRAPRPWSMALPASWIVERGTESARASSLQADNVRRGDLDAPDEVVGKLAFAVLAREVGAAARDVAELYLGAVREGGVDIGAPEITEDDAPGPFTFGWRLRARAERAGVQGEIACRVLAADAGWVLAGVLSPSVDEDAAAWMQNRRALALACATARWRSA
jgi:hypothetical protein